MFVMEQERKFVIFLGQNRNGADSLWWTNLTIRLCAKGGFQAEKIIRFSFALSICGDMMRRMLGSISLILNILSHSPKTRFYMLCR